MAAIDWNDLHNVTQQQLSQQGHTILSKQGQLEHKKLMDRILACRQRLTTQQELMTQVPNYIAQRLINSINSFSNKLDEIPENQRADISVIEESRDRKLDKVKREYDFKVEEAKKAYDLLVERAKRAYDDAVSDITSKSNVQIGKIKAEYSIKERGFQERVTSSEQNLLGTGETNKQIAKLRIELRELIAEYDSKFFPRKCNVTIPNIPQATNNPPLTQPQPALPQEKKVDIWEGYIQLKHPDGTITHETPETLAEEMETARLRKEAQDAILHRQREEEAEAEGKRQKAEADRKAKLSIEAERQKEKRAEELKRRAELEALSDTDDDSDAGLTPAQLTAKNWAKDERREAAKKPIALNDTISSSEEEFISRPVRPTTPALSLPPAKRLIPKKTVPKRECKSLGAEVNTYSTPLVIE